MKTIIIKDEKVNVFFGFSIQFPGVCAQAETEEKVKEKINNYMISYLMQ